ncbi:MAG TPA: Uma2 family endonuclease [Planktothrix sp.]|jgi:Uma2 family endonuclease
MTGDKMEQPDFCRLYMEAPEGYRAELIGGIVFEPPPPGYDHGSNDSSLISLLAMFSGLTDGVDGVSAVSVVLGGQDQVEPDCILRIESDFGGKSRIGKKHRKSGVRLLEGAPELVAEVAHTSRAIDLHLKKDRYKLAGVIEYVVLCIKPLELYWFLLQEDRNLEIGADGIYRSKVFPGLWIDRDALLKRDYKKSMLALNAGMDSVEYHTFADLLRARK